jgi:hypothetical protein
MASQWVKTRLRITGGLLIIVLTLVFVIILWSQAPNVWTGIALSGGAVGTMVMGIALVLGRTWAWQPEGAATSTTTLTDRNVRVWNRVVLVSAVVGVLLCCIGVVATATGNLTLASVVLPLTVIFLAFATLIWVQLRSVKRQAKGAP